MMRDLALSYCLKPGDKWYSLLLKESWKENTATKKKTTKPKTAVNHSLEPRLISSYGPKEVRGPS